MHADIERFPDCKISSLCRYFVLDAELGQLHYFVNEQGRSQKPRGSLPLFGASVTPSDEAPHMFIVNSVNGELYKLRGESRAQILRVEQLVFMLWTRVLVVVKNDPPPPPLSICE